MKKPRNYHSMLKRRNAERMKTIRCVHVENIVGIPRVGRPKPFVREGKLGVLIRIGKSGTLVRMGESGSSGRMGRPNFLPCECRPLHIAISTGGASPQEVELLKELEAKGRISKITWIESNPGSLDDKIKYVLSYLHTDEAKKLGCRICKGYDYAWIKLAMDSKRMPERYSSCKYMSTPKFVEYIKSLGFTDIAGSKTINKAKSHAKWQSETNILTFHGISLSAPERKRRNMIAWKFLEMMNEV